MVRAMYRTLARNWGRQHWWPAATPFEVMVGAILTQNTSWRNVERAMASLRSAGALTVAGIRAVPLPELQELVRSSGYYRQKAQRLKGFVNFLDANFGGSVEAMLATSTAQLRTQLLALKGVGEETADSILLYAGNHEIFVVDAYTRRIFERHRLLGAKARYDEIRVLVERALRGIKPSKGEPLKRRPPHELQIHTPSPMSTTERSSLAQTYNEMHGLFVQVGKHYCLKQEPNCEACPLRALLP